MNGHEKVLGLGYNGLARAVSIACLGMAAQQALAQEPVEEVTVTGSRLIQSGVNTPTPVTAVSAAELQTMAPTTLIESLSQLPVFDNNLTSQQAVGGSVASGVTFTTSVSSGTSGVGVGAGCVFCSGSVGSCGG